MATYSPGDSASLLTLATTLDADAAKFTPLAAAIGAVTAPSLSEPWLGWYSQMIKNRESAMTDASTAYTAGADAIRTFAGILNTLNTNVRNAEQQLVNAQQQLSAATTLADIARCLAAVAQASANLRQVQTSSLAQWQTAFTTCAEALVNAANLAHQHGGGGPFALDPAMPSGVTYIGDVLDEVQPLTGQVDLSDAAFDPSVTTQGNAGDCWYLSALMAMAKTEKGREQLKKNLEWDPVKGGYWVTLYKDGSPERFFVDHVYNDGANSGKAWSGNPSWISVYEAALAVRSGGPNTDGVNGGWSSDAFEMLTGNEGSQGAADVDEIRRHLANGEYVTAGTIPDPAWWQFWKDDSKLEVTVPVENPPGQWNNQAIEVIRGHAYMVDRVDADGNIYVRNPWGPGNPGGDGGLIKLSKEQFEELFDGAEYGK